MIPGILALKPNTNPIAPPAGVPVVNTPAQIYAHSNGAYPATGVVGMAVGTLTATNSPTSWTITAQTVANGFALSNSGVLTGGSAAASLAPANAGTTYNVTVTASNAAGTSAAVVVPIIMWPDGFLDAPTGSAQYPTLLDTYGFPPMWKVPGVHYRTGISTGTTLTSWLTNTLPSGCSRDLPNKWIRVNAPNVVFDSWDFSAGGGGQILCEDVGLVVTNCKFGGVNAANFPVAQIQLSGAGARGFTIRYNEFDSGATSVGQVAGVSSFVTAGIDATHSGIFEYNWSYHQLAHRIEVGGAGLLRIRFNSSGDSWIESGGHMNGQQLYDAPSPGITVVNTFNCMNQSSLGGAEWPQFYFGSGSGILKDSMCCNNVHIAVLNGGVKTMSYIMHGSEGATISGTQQMNDNYFDATGAVGVWYPVASQPTGWTGWSFARNIYLTDGTTVPPP